MRQNNRQPRPANQRPQAHDPGEHTVGSSPSQGSGATWRDPTDHERLQPRALDRQFRHLIERLFEFGWTPLDLFEALRRKVSVAAVGLVLDMAAFATAEHPARLVDPRWQAQLEQFDARVPPPGSSPSLEWARRQKHAWPAAAEQLIAVLAFAASMPVVARVMSPPGSAHSVATTTDGIDAKVLRRVRGLLAKAESTEHDEEAQALTAKAQELMTRYSIERTLAQTHQTTRSTPTVRRLWLDSPYVVAKSLLVTAVAGANHCRSVLAEDWGFVTIIGHDSDLDVVELLTTSLLVQAIHAMTLTGSQFTRSGVSRTRSFRQSFLVAFARRIRERLHESASTTEAAENAERGGALLPVLAARTHAVEDKLAQLFPGLEQRDISVSNAAGWGAGRAAADLAHFDIRDAVTQRERAG